MRVSIGSGGPFHAFDLARQMKRLGCLERLYTAYPAFKVEGLDGERIESFPWLMAPAVVAARLGIGWLTRPLNLAAILTFDRWMAGRLGPCDVFHCLSGFGTLTHEIARKRYGALTVCDRGSAHIVAQREILREEYQRFGLPFRGPDRRLVERELQEYESCDLISVPSRFAGRSFVERGIPPGKLRLNPFGVDLSVFKPAVREDGVFRAIYVGRMSLRKGLPYLLKALAPLSLRDFELLLVGPAQAEVRTVLSKYEGQYRHIGAVAQRELYKYYSQASVFVIASVEEGFGLVQAQAMACGLPVIATTNTGAEDLFTNGVEGFIVPIRSPEAIREKVVYLYENPDVRDQMAAAARDRVRSLGGWDNYGDRMKNCYSAALADRTSVKPDAANSLF